MITTRWEALHVQTFRRDKTIDALEWGYWRGSRLQRISVHSHPLFAPRLNALPSPRQAILTR